VSRRDKKRERERLWEARTEREQAAFRAAVPFTREDLVELLDRLSRLEPAAEAFEHTRSWAAERHFAWEPIAAAFAAQEISSDRELLLEANPYFLFGPTPRRLAWMPIERAQLEALLDHVDGAPCDHTPGVTAQWLAEHRLPVPETLAALRAQGGFCDCEMANVEPEQIYPPPLQAVFTPPPPKPRSPVAKPTEYRDAALVLPLPGKPWRSRSDAKLPQVKLELQFGSGFLKPSLRILAVARPDDERAWCLARWRQMHLEGWHYVRGETPEDAEQQLAARWLKERRELVGPEAAECGGSPARWYLSKGQGFPVDAGWCLLELPGGFRVVELDVATGTWDPFQREARKLLTALAPA
jgi:hypothetical protein